LKNYNLNRPTFVVLLQDDEPIETIFGGVYELAKRALHFFCAEKLHLIRIVCVTAKVTNQASSNHQANFKVGSLTLHSEPCPMCPI
jgi:hypothetical protein